MNSLRKLDYRWSEGLYLFTKKTPWFLSFVKVVRVFSNIVSLPLVFVVLFLYGNKTVAIPLAVIFTVFFLSNEFFIKAMVRRQRPPWSPLAGFAFPSSHSVATGLFVVLMLTLPSAWKFAVLPFLILVPASRIALGLHYLSDVIGGVFIGMALSSILIWQLLL